MNEVIVRDQKPQHSFAELEKMAGAVAKSGLFGVKTQDQALALMMLAQAEGTHPAIAARDYHIIDGRPALKADAMLARFMAAGGKVEWHSLTDAVVAATFSHPIGGTLRIEWTIEQATRAGLTKKDNWVKYPRAMLRSRVVSEGIRSVWPAVITGVYTVDELRDGIADEILDVTPVKPSDPTVVAEVAASLTESQIADFNADIDSASTLEDLKKSHAAAYRAAHAIGDRTSLLEFEAKKESAKARLAA